MAVWECEDGYRRCCDCDYGWKTITAWCVGVAVSVTVVVVLVLAFAVVKPPTATADDALLTRFALTAGAPSPAANSTASYNVTVTLSLRNPNIYRAMSFDPVAATFSYNGSRFDESATFPRFTLGARKTTTFRVTVGGVDKPVKLTPDAVAEFKAESAKGRFAVELKLETKLQYKGRSARCPLAVICNLDLQLFDPEVASTSFERGKCTILRAKQSGC